MSQNMLSLEFENLPVRSVVGDSGETLWVAKDICDILGYANHNDALKLHCGGVAKSYPIPDSLGRLQETRVIGESDVFKLISRCTLPAAEKFNNWLFGEVLPSIKKTGTYTLPNSRSNQVVGDLLLTESTTRQVLLSELLKEHAGKIESLMVWGEAANDRMDRCERIVKGLAQGVADALMRCEVLEARVATLESALADHRQSVSIARIDLIGKAVGRAERAAERLQARIRPLEKFIAAAGAAAA